jgi:uncharacterized protein YdhG (YjbR/CyaY superfamily)
MSARSKPAAKPTTVDAYLKAVNPDQRKALQKLRQDIHSVAPGAEECISYGMLAFRWKGKFLVAFGAAKMHCAFYPGSIVREFADELSNYDTAKGTIRFQPDKPLPKGLVTNLIKARIAQQSPQQRSDWARPGYSQRR